MVSSQRLKVGDLVEVKSKSEILRTLDNNGQLEGMPFMPEMFAYCGRRFRVTKRAHKACDTVFPTRSRKITNAVHLETRCNGDAHGGCQAGCLIYWKEAWLKPVSTESGRQGERFAPSSTADDHGCTEADVLRGARADREAETDEPVYVCQATRLPYASHDLSPYDFRQYIEDYVSGNVSFTKWLAGICYIVYQHLIKLGIGLGTPLRWLYENTQTIRRGLPYPHRTGAIPPGEPTPSAKLDLHEGDWVKVKSYREILGTLTTENKNRGLLFDGEMLPYCGGHFQVRTRVEQIIDEATGKMLRMKNPCIILDGVVCQARYSECRLFCPRQIYPYWREVWLERSADPRRG